VTGDGGPSAGIHGSAASWAGRGVLILGEPGGGKSTLLAQLLAAGAYLVADDLVRVEARDGGLRAQPAAGASGLIELRSGGIFRVATTVGVQVNLCVEVTSAPERERLPLRATTRIAGVEVPALRSHGPGTPTVGQVLLALCARRAD
jgi:serine kinase of HPr protein (carbohydrate metabolism regulator)